MIKAARKSWIDTLQEMPLFLLACGLASASMIIPSLFALSLDDEHAARLFFYTGFLGTLICILIGVVMAGRPMPYRPLGPLLSLFSIMCFLPFLLAVPFYEALRTTSFLNAYVEMVSSVTTTGASFYPANRLPETLHLWRAQVAWMGGFTIWLAAGAILAPLNLGGFEVTARAERGRARQLSHQIERAGPRIRVFRAAAVLFPIYTGLTGFLWLLLIVSGEDGFVALCHAMGVLSSSGISPVGGPVGGQIGGAGEILLALFMVFALSRLAFSTDTVAIPGKGLHSDPEFRLACVIVLTVSLFLFLRHWLGPLGKGEETLAHAIQALWGSFFTVLSFLTTTGYVSGDWEAARYWAGLDSASGLILLGLALIGGGVATTAGGVKLLRVYAIYQQGRGEMQRLIHPSSVIGLGALGRRIGRNGAFIAWIFFMLFALALAAISLVFSAFGLSFEEAMVLSVAGLSNTGPLILEAPDDPIALIELPAGAKMVLAAAMVVGRLETLAIVALFTPDLWRS